MKLTNCYLLFLIVASAISLSASCGDKDKDQDNDQTVLEEVGSGEGDGYKLVWEDLFNEETLDKSTWNVEVNADGGGNRELQYYREENVTLGKEPATGRNCLILTARKENFGGRNATSGRVNSLGKKYFKYGKVEASIKLPKTANGLWPAFWMMGNDFSQIGWPRCGEIDIMEMGHATGIANGTQDRHLIGALHWGILSGGGHPNHHRASLAPYGLHDDFHLYTVIWDETSIRMYLDLDKNPEATPYFQMAITNRDGDSAPGNYFHKEFFILFNLAVGGNFPSIHNIAGITALDDGDANMYIDYVKVFQKED